MKNNNIASTILTPVFLVAFIKASLSSLAVALINSTVDKTITKAGAKYLNTLNICCK